MKPPSVDGAELVRTRLRVTRLDRLRPYENISEDKIAVLVNAISTSGVLRDPVVADVDLKLTIDGHHRVEALRRLGFTLAPMFHIDYESADIEIKPFPVYLGCSSQKIASLFTQVSQERQHRPGVLSLRVSSRDGTGFEVMAPGFRQAAANLERVRRFVSGAGIGAVQGLSSDWQEIPTEYLSNCFLLGGPRKEDVLDAASQGRPFPPQVCKHVVAFRVVGLNFPVRNLRGSISEAESELRRMVGERSFVVKRREWNCLGANSEWEVRVAPRQ